MPEPTSLAAKRAEKSQDARDWTARDAAVELLRMIDAGEALPAQIAIHWMEGGPDVGYRHHHLCAGVTYPQHIALLAVAQHAKICDWLT